MNPYSEIPEEMKRARRWLVWRLQDGKKIPYYTTGKVRGRRIGLDTDGDIQKLSTFDEALAALNKGYTGMGFALGPDGSGNFWQGIDLDKVEANRLTDIGSKLPGYVEESPSGAGLHSIGYGSPFKTLGSNGTGIEAYSERRYFTVTGNAYRGSICDIANFVSHELSPHHSRMNCLLTEVTEVTEVTGFHSNHKHSQAITEVSGKGEGEAVALIHALPANCKPSAAGTRNRVLFNLARHLKSRFPNSADKDMLDVVKNWHATFVSIIASKDFTTTWLDFRTSWGKVKFLEGDGLLHRIADDVDLDTIPPEEIRMMGYEGTTWGCIQLCYRLSLAKQNGIFFLSSRKIEELFGIPQRTACNLLKFMVDDGILEAVEAHTRTKATVYRYTWPHPLFSKDSL